jgi:hypothetical protein
MITKQTVIRTIETLPENAGWTEISDALLNLVAHQGTARDFAKLYLGQIQPNEFDAYAQPKLDVSLSALIKELEAKSTGKDAK